MNDSKTKNCQNCKSEFQIEPEDFEFYKKIDVPEPTFCPECRSQRRMAWRNEHKLYKRKCDFSQEEIFSWLPSEASAKVYDTKVWWGDEWDAVEYGRDYDFSRPFFEQYAELLKEAPLPSRSIVNLVNSDYSMNASDLKNCYYVFNAGKSEDCNYGTNVDMCKDCVDNLFLSKCELCHESVMMTNCYKAFFSSHCDDSQNILFCKDCKNCSDCFGCVNLHHKKYHIFNKEYSKEEYFKKLKEFGVGSYANKEEIWSNTQEFWLKSPVRFMYGRKNEDVSGEYIFNSKNVKDSYMVDNGENLRFCHHTRFNPSAKDCYDYYGIGRNTELSYEDLIVGRNASRIKFCSNCYENVQNFEYCVLCVSSSDLFGCVSLRKKQYCILNKQYSKEEYEKMIPKIKEHMNEMPYTDKQGNVYKYGEFFPTELSPFGYNITPAQEEFPLTKEQAEEKGYTWIDKPRNTYQSTIKAKDLPDNIKYVNDSILGEIIECSNASSDSCQGSDVFQIIPAELEFLQEHSLPLPRFCPECRHSNRIKRKNSINLYKRQCMKEGCDVSFQTTYSPEREEIVYCKECYQKETE